METEIKKKVCPNCLQEKEANQVNFYRKPDGKNYFNVCRECKLAYGAQRHKEKRKGTFVKRHKIVVGQLTGKLKTCSRCNQEKDEAHFRKYATTAKSGKKYTYRTGRCRGCEAENEKDRRFEKEKFDEKQFHDITDHYNR